MTYLPIVLGLLAALFWGISDYFAAKPSKELGPHRTTPYVLLFSAITILPFLLYTGVNPGINPFLLLFAVFTPFASFLGYFFIYRAFKQGNLSITAPIVTAYPVVTVLGAVFILGDRLSQVEIISIAAVILGIILLSTKFSSFGSKRKLVAAGVGSAILSTLFIGSPAIFYGAYAAVIGYALLGFVGRGGGCALAFASGYIRKDNLSVPKRKHLPWVAAAGITDAFAILVFIYAISAQGTALPIVSALSGFSGGVTVLLALAFLRERPEANQWLGILLAIIGVVVLSYLA